MPGELFVPGQGLKLQANYHRTPSATATAVIRPIDQQGGAMVDVVGGMSKLEQGALQLAERMVARMTLPTHDSLDNADGIAKLSTGIARAVLAECHRVEREDAEALVAAMAAVAPKKTPE